VFTPGTARVIFSRSLVLTKDNLTLDLAESDSKKERAEDACVSAAKSDYLKANNALVQQTATVMSVHRALIRPGTQC
jgi:hypothetical protein